jgi:4-amino-4-deoxy-L-arabinose transferase-like glycosyltransferase
VLGASAPWTARVRAFGPLAALLAVAAAVRAYQISRESVWVDEGLSVRLARSSWPALLAGTGEDGHPPLYLALLHVWIACFGTSEAAIRSLSAVLGVLAVAAVYALGRLWFDHATGRCAALLVALSPYHIYYSQEARNYSLLVLTSALSYLGLALLRHRPGRAASAFYVLATISMLYTHVFGFFTWIAQNVYVLWIDGGRSGPARRKWIALQAMVIAALLPWVWGPWARRLIAQASPATTALRLARPTLGAMPAAILAYTGTPLGFLLTAPWAAAESWRALRARWRRRAAAGAGPETQGDEAALLLVLGVALPHLIPFVYSQLRVPIYLTRATIVALPPFYLLVAHALVRRRAWGAVGAAAIVLSALAAQHAYSKLVSKEQWRDVAKTVDGFAETGDLVVFDPGYGAEAFDFYSRRRDLRHARLAADLVTPAGTEELSRARAGAGRVWVVRLQRPHDDDGVMRALADGYVPVESERYAGIDLYLFRRRPPPAP